jgi:hypothetical protein
MKTFVEFRSSKFPAYSGEEEEINPGIWGRRLAEHLIERLEQNGIETNGYFMEDWGYYLPIEIEGCRFGLCCGHQYGDGDQLIVFTDPRTPKFRKLFRSVDVTPQLTKLVDAVARILDTDPDIREINWIDS